MIQLVWKTCLQIWGQTLRNKSLFNFKCVHVSGRCFLVAVPSSRLRCFLLLSPSSLAKLYSFHLAAPRSSSSVFSNLQPRHLRQSKPGVFKPPPAFLSSRFGEVRFHGGQPESVLLPLVVILDKGRLGQEHFQPEGCPFSASGRARPQSGDSNHQLGNIQERNVFVPFDPSLAAGDAGWQVKEMGK